MRSADTGSLCGVAPWSFFHSATYVHTSTLNRDTSRYIRSHRGHPRILFFIKPHLFQERGKEERKNERTKERRKKERKKKGRKKHVRLRHVVGMAISWFAPTVLSGHATVTPPGNPRRHHRTAEWRTLPRGGHYRGRLCRNTSHHQRPCVRRVLGHPCA